MARRRQNTLGLAVAIIFLGLAASAFFYTRVASQTKVAVATPSATPKPKMSTPAKPSKITDFPHDRAQHSKLACNSCHKFPSANWKTVRKEADAFPDITEYPRHESCLKCHRPQFFASGGRPDICSVCHTNPKPGDSSRFAFPNPREVFDQTPKGKAANSDFAISFPHDKHIEIVSQKHPRGGEGFVNASFTRSSKRAGEESCSVCHQTYQPQGKSDDEYVTKPPEKLGDGFWLKKGTFKTVPIGHTTCFTCHSADTGILPAPENCAACHKIAEKLPAADFDTKVGAAMGDLDKITLSAWRRRDSSGTFRHEFSSHADLECANCHAAASIVTTDAKTKKVAVTSCNMCHITATSDDGGILNFEVDSRKKDAAFQCVKCHISYGRMPIPESHLKAIVAAGQ